MIIILVVIIGTGIWRWKLGENVAPDFTIKKEAEKIVVMTDDNIDRRYHVPLGTVYGEAIITVHMVTDLWAGAKTAIGGEPVQYQKMMTMTRKIAVNRMKMDAYEKGATLITGHRLATTQIVERAAEVMAYGTAWKRLVEL
jgi:uncharacterized protein YbjQ (UPF0145 family)